MKMMMCSGGQVVTKPQQHRVERQATDKWQTVWASPFPATASATSPTAPPSRQSACVSAAHQARMHWASRGRRAPFGTATHGVGPARWTRQRARPGRPIVIGWRQGWGGACACAGHVMARFRLGDADRQRPRHASAGLPASAAAPLVVRLPRPVHYRITTSVFIYENIYM